MALVTADTPMQETLLQMSEKGFGIACVVEDDKLVGVISDGDLRRNMDDLMNMTAGQVASANPASVTPDLLAAKALAILSARKIGVLMVVDDAARPVGILHLHDILRAGVV